LFKVISYACGWEDHELCPEHQARLAAGQAPLNSWLLGSGCSSTYLKTSICFLFFSHKSCDERAKGCDWCLPWGKVPAED